MAYNLTCQRIPSTRTRLQGLPLVGVTIDLDAIVTYIFVDLADTIVNLGTVVVYRLKNVFDLNLLGVTMEGAKHGDLRRSDAWVNAVGAVTHKLR